jgi:hypothetical protein
VISLTEESEQLKQGATRTNTANTWQQVLKPNANATIAALEGSEQMIAESATRFVGMMAWEIKKQMLWQVSIHRLVFRHVGYSDLSQCRHGANMAAHPGHTPQSFLAIRSCTRS